MDRYVFSIQQRLYAVRIKKQELSPKTFQQQSDGIARALVVNHYRFNLLPWDYSWGWLIHVIHFTRVDNRNTFIVDVKDVDITISLPTSIHKNAR
jgi:hypothetical protein